MWYSFLCVTSQFFSLEFYRVEFRWGLQCLSRSFWISALHSAWKHYKCSNTALHSITQVITENTGQNCSQIIPWETLLSVSFLFDSDYQQRLLKYRLSLTRLLQTITQKPKLFIHGTVVSKTSYLPSADKGWAMLRNLYKVKYKSYAVSGEKEREMPSAWPLPALYTSAV